MSISNENNRNQYEGNNLTDVFAYSYKITDNEDIKVVYTDSNEIETTLILDTDYSVSGAGEDIGGSITYPISGSPLATGEHITLVRNVPYTQATDLNNQGGFYPETVENMSDKNLMLLQQLKEEVDRCPKLPTGTTDDPGSYFTVIKASEVAAATSATAALVSENAAAISATAYNVVTNLVADIATAGSTNTTLVIADIQTITADLIIPSNITLDIKHSGQITGAYTLTLNGGITAGLYRIFADVLSVVISGNLIQEVYPEWWGAKGDNTVDCTAYIQEALNVVQASKSALHITPGIYKLTDTLVVRNISTYVSGGWTIKGDGYQSVLYQTGAGKSVLEIGRELPSGIVAMEGITIKDLSLVGTTGTLYGLYINEVARSNFDNLYIMADNSDLAIKGGLINTWSGIKLTYAPFNENPILGIVIPTTRQYGLNVLPGSLNSYTTNSWSGLVVEGHSVGGMYIEGGSTNTYNNIVLEGELGYGLQSSSEWDCYEGIYTEGITGTEFKLLNTQKCTIKNLFATSGKVILSNSGLNTFIACTAAEWNFSSASGSNRNVWIGCSGNITRDVEYYNIYHTTISSNMTIDASYTPTHHGFACNGVDIVGNSYMERQTQYQEYSAQTLAFKHRALPNDVIYDYRSIEGSKRGWSCVNRIDTAMIVQAVATDTTMKVDSTTGILAGDIIGIVLDNSTTYDTYHWTTVASITDVNTLEITDAIPTSRTANINAEVYTNRWSTFGNTYLTGTLVWDPGSIADGSSEVSAAITVKGAVLGDFVLVSPPYATITAMITGAVNSANDVRIKIYNLSGGALNYGSGTWKVMIIKST